MIQNPPIFQIALAVLIGMAHVLLQAWSATKDTGLKWNIGPRDEPHAIGPLAGRLDRAFVNFRETFPLFVAAMLAAYLGGQVDDLVVGAGWVYLVCRALYIPLYAFAVSGVRSLVWVVSFAAIGVVVAAVLI